MTPEEKARQNIDQQLEACGWKIYDFGEMDIFGGPGVAVREFKLDTGYVDYCLYIDGRSLALSKRRRKGTHSLVSNRKRRCTSQEYRRASRGMQTLYKPGEPLDKRRQCWSEKKNPEGRWRSFTYDENVKRDKTNLDIFWLKDDSHDDSENLPPPEILAQEIAEDLQTALEQFSSIAAELNQT